MHLRVDINVIMYTLEPMYTFIVNYEHHYDTSAPGSRLLHDVRHVNSIMAYSYLH